MGVLCGKCGNTHTDSENVRACYEQTETDMQLLRRKTKPRLHPLNKVAFARYTKAAQNLRRLQEVPRDDERNLAGVRRARAALRQVPAQPVS